MIAALIFVISIASFFQFFISYCHAVLISAGGVELSTEIQEIAGFASEPRMGADGRRIAELARLIPELVEAPSQARMMNVYRAFLRVAQNVARPTMLPSAAGWIETERKGLVHFTAVSLDRRISANRALVVEQAAAL